MLDAEGSLADRYRRLVVETSQSHVGKAHADGEMEKWKHEHHPRGILAERNRIPYNYESVPEETKDSEEDVRRRKPPVADRKTGSSLVQGESLGDRSHDPVGLFGHGII